MIAINPKISIIVPVYNVSMYLSRCIDSILSQTFSDFELLLIDDGSKDDSGNICEEYASKDNRVRVFHKINEGVSSARNLGLDEAKGEWITFVDSDDWLEIKCLEIILKQVDEDKLDCIQFSFKRVNGKGDIFETYSAETSIMSLGDYVDEGMFNVCVWGSMFKKKICDKLNIRFLDGLKLGEDQIFILTVMTFCKRIKRISDTFYCYYLNENSATQNPKFLDLCQSILAFNDFKYRNKFINYIDKMIFEQTFAALLHKDCDMYFLYKILKMVKVNSRMVKSDSFCVCFLKKTWNLFLFPSLFVMKIRCKFIKT